MLSHCAGVLNQVRIGRWASSNSVEQIQYYGKASKVRRSLLSCARGKASSETNTELKSLDLRSPHKDTERRQRETVSGRAKMPRTTLVGSGVVGVIGWREGKTSGSEHWHMCPQVAERINDLLSTEGLSPVKCRSLSLARARLPSPSLSVAGILMKRMLRICRDKFLIGLCNIVARASFGYRRAQFRKWRFLVSQHLVTNPKTISSKPHL